MESVRENHATDDVSPDSPPPPPPEPKNHYETLGVSRTATESEISKQYKTLALRFHPDRNRGNPEATNVFKALAEANSVLSDPNKRRQYDLSLADGSAAGAERETVDLANLGQVGRVFGAFAGKLGIPIPTSIGQDTLVKAYEICQETGLREENPHLLPMRLGVEYRGSVDRQQGQFFMLRVAVEVAESGLVLVCQSNNKSRFKVVIFDEKGGVRFQEESVKSASDRHTICHIFLAPFEVGYLGDSLPPNFDLELPPIFHRLDTLQMIKRGIEAGDHLVCVYGDNFLRAANFSLIAVPLGSQAEIQRQTLTDLDNKLIEQRGKIKEFQAEYIIARDQWMATQAKLEELSNTTHSLIQTREQACDQVVSASRRACAHPSEEHQWADIHRLRRDRERERELSLGGGIVQHKNRREEENLLANLGKSFNTSLNQLFAKR